jgi:hypothetical protein
MNIVMRLHGATGGLGEDERKRGRRRWVGSWDSGRFGLLGYKGLADQTAGVCARLPRCNLAPHLI